MGLDAVEILMEVEDAFEISISDAEAETTLTPRELINLVMSKVGCTDRAVCLTQRAFHRLRAALRRQTGTRRDWIRPDTPTRQLLPGEGRKTLLKAVLEDIGIADMPELVRPSWLVKLIGWAALGAGMLAGGLVHLQASDDWIDRNTWPLVGIGVVGAVAWLAALLTRGVRNEFIPALATVGGFSRWIVAHGPNVVEAPPGQWSREQVAARVREIVINQLGCEKKYREDARFIQDLGLG